MNEEIKEKLEYCLNCKTKPCSNKGCPLGNNIPGFIQKLKEKKYEDAYDILNETTVLQSLCGRICPHQKQCEGSCVRGIKGNSVSIGELEAFIGDIALQKDFKIKTDTEDKYKSKKVAIVGGGPAGLTCATFLAKKGVQVTIYEKYNYLGGLLIHGIPDFRLPKDIVQKTINKILELGIKVRYNMILGENLNLKELEYQYDAVFISIGANTSSKMGIEGENLKGVYGANELLEYKDFPDLTGKIVAVNGGGNVAMDAARTMKRMGAKEVIVIYRRSREQMPAEDKEIEDAINDGIKFLFKNNIIKIIGNQKVEKLELVKTELIKKDGDERLSPVNIEESNYEIPIDYVVMALGSNPSREVEMLNLNLNKNNTILINENGVTSNDKIYAGGDVANITNTVAWAARSGRNAAKSILNKLI
mgnify:FL=1